MSGHFRLALLALCAVAGWGSQAAAHLIAPRQATIHVVGASVYSVVWLPASALLWVDADGDGLVSQAELERNQAELIQRLQSRWQLSDGTEQATPVRLDLILQPADDAPPDRANRADQVVMLHHARFSHPPAQVALDTDLFGRFGALDPELTVSASSDRGAERATLRPGQAHHRFFAPRSLLERVGTLPPAPVLWTAAISVIALLLGVMVSLGHLKGRKTWNVA